MLFYRLIHYGDIGLLMAIINQWLYIQNIYSTDKFTNYMIVIFNFKVFKVLI